MNAQQAAALTMYALAAQAAHTMANAMREYWQNNRTAYSAAYRAAQAVQQAAAELAHIAPGDGDHAHSPAQPDAHCRRRALP